MYYLKSRYYDPLIGRFISPDSIEYLEPNNVNGLNLYAYCYNNPINYVDPSGNFALTATMILGTIVIGTIIGAGIGLGSTIAKDLGNGHLFDGDVTLLSYLGNTLGGGIAGAGIGLFSVLGAGLGSAFSAGTALTIAGNAISGLTAFTIGLSGAFLTGGLGYSVRTAISDQETFEWSDMFIEATSNAVSGILTFIGSLCGGIIDVKVPGAKFSLKNFILYHFASTYFGIYPAKIFISYIKKKLKEKY